MGAGTSTLPTKLKEEDLQHIVSEMFNSFKDSDGYVDKELLITAAFTGQEKEVVDLFMKFSKRGFMDAKGFHDFCVEAKLLNRTNFTATESVLIFQKALVTQNTTTGANTISINYPIFRRIILPEISEKKSLHLDNLIFRLSRVECNMPRLIVLSRQNSHNTEKEKVVSPRNQPKSIREDEFDDIPVVDVSEEAESNLTPKPSKYSITGSDLSTTTGTPKQHHAATRIQSMSRMRTASRYVNELKQINSMQSVLVDTEEQLLPTPSQPAPDIEPIIKDYFMKFTLYSHPDQIDLTRFLKLCNDSSLIQKKFTVVDAELAFIRAKKKASISNQAKYKNGVFYDKRINYIVFREILLRCIIEKTGEPIDIILHQLINAAKTRK